MEVRAMLDEDYDACLGIWLACSGMGLNNIDDSRSGIARFIQRNPRTCFVAQEGTRLVGVVMAGHDGRRGCIYHLAVHPTARGRGIGSSLVEHALQALAQEGITKVNLVAFCRNQAGIRFWMRQGFVVRDDLAYLDRSLVKMIRIDT